MTIQTIETSKKWVSGFVRFLHDATKTKASKAFYDVITLDASIGRRIGLGGGIKDKVPPFIGLQLFDAVWFVQMPWVELILERNALVFVADPSQSGLTAPLFGIRIPISPDYALVLSRFRELDVRQIEIDRTGSICDLKPDTLMRLALNCGRVERLGARPRISRGAF